MCTRRNLDPTDSHPVKYRRQLPMLAFTQITHLPKGVLTKTVRTFKGMTREKREKIFESIPVFK